MMDETIISPNDEKIRLFIEEHTKRERTQAEIDSFLSGLDSVTFDRKRKEMAKALGLRSATLDDLFKRSRTEDEDSLSGSALEFPEVEPWPETVDGSALLDEIHDLFKRHIVISNESLTIVTLWTVFSWIFDLFDTCSILFVTSPQKRCGKTTLLGILTRLLYRVLAASNITASALFRVIEKARPSLVIDEADSFVKDNEDLRGIVNSGHTRTGAFVIRTVGDEHEPRKFSTWGPKVFAGIGSALPDTLEDRSIRLELKRKTKLEKTQKVRAHVIDPKCREIASKIARWTQDHLEDFGTQKTCLPEIDNDRAYDNWTPLGVIATVAGRHWPERVKVAFLLIEGLDDPTETEPLSIELLRALKEIFDGNKNQISTHDLVESLRSDPDGPWETGINYGRGLDARSLSKFLKPFGIRPHTIRIGNSTPKGYQKADFTDAFSRYLSQKNISDLENPENYPPHDTNKDQSHFSRKNHPTQESFVVDEKSSQSPNGSHCVNVSDKNPVSGKMEHFSEERDPVSVPFDL